MPPKVKITKEEIVSAALSLVREKGEGALNVRAVADVLGCSTQPVFSNFATMGDLKEAVLRASYKYYYAFLKEEAAREQYPQYKAFGMAYIDFAAKERALFQLLFMRDRTGEDLSPSLDFEQSVKMIMQANGVDAETAGLIHLEMWSCVHGIATMLVTSFLSLDMALISRMLSDVYQGISARYKKEGDAK